MGTLSVLPENVIYVRTYKQKAASMAACRWGNQQKVTVKDFQCQLGNRNLKDAETQTKIIIALSLLANSGSAAFVTAPKLPHVFSDETVRPCEVVSLNCLSELEKLRCLDITQIINEAIETTKLQPLSQDSMEQKTVSKQACKLSPKKLISRISYSYIKNSNQSIENLTNNGEILCKKNVKLIPKAKKGKEIKQQ